EEDAARHPSGRGELGAVPMPAGGEDGVGRPAGEEGREVEDEDTRRVLHNEVPRRAADEAVHHPALVVLEPEIAVVDDRLEGGEAGPAVAPQAAVEDQHMEGRKQQDGRHGPRGTVSAGGGNHRVVERRIGAGKARRGDYATRSTGLRGARLPAAAGGR